MVVGDTASDMVAGLRAGAGYCVGVLSGTDDQARLIANGADDVIDSVVDLLSLIFWSRTSHVRDACNVVVESLSGVEQFNVVTVRTSVGVDDPVLLLHLGQLARKNLAVAPEPPVTSVFMTQWHHLALTAQAFHSWGVTHI